MNNLRINISVLNFCMSIGFVALILAFNRVLKELKKIREILEKKENIS